MKIQEKPDYLIFAESAKKGEVSEFPDVSRGWGITIEQTGSKPPMEWMNGAFNRVDKNMLYLLQQGVPEWNESVKYPANAIIKHNGVLYTAIVENDNAKPSAETGKWVTIIDDKYLPAKKIANESYETNSALNFKKRPRLNDSDMIAMTDFYLQSGNVGFDVSPTGVIRQWMLVVLNEVGESLGQEIGNITYYTKYYSIALPVSFLRAAYNVQVTVACGTMSNQGGMATLSASANITDSLSRVTVAVTSYDPRVRPALYLTAIGE